MALSLLNTNEVQVARLVKALYNAAPGYTFMTNFSGYAAAKGLNGLAEGLVADFAANDNATLAAAVATNVGLTGAALTAATAYLQGQFEFYGAAKRGQVILDAVNGLSNLTADATYGAAATAFNDTIATSVAYSSNSSNNSTTLATLQAAIVPSGSTIALTSGTDNAAGTAYGDTFTGTMSSTLTGIDRVNGSTGNDTFKITLGAAGTVTPLAITDVETVRLTGATGAANNVLDVKYATGLTLLEFNDVTTTAGATHTIQGITSPSIPLQVKNATATTTTLNFTHAAAGLTGTADTVGLTLTDNGTSAAYVAAVEVNTAGIEGLTVASTGSANYITNLTTAGDVKTLTITGSAPLTVTTLGGADSSLTKIDATAASGGVNIDTSFAANIAVTGGAGNDTFVFAGNLDINDTVNGGEGTDSVSVGAGDGNAVATNVTLTSIENLTLTAGADQLLSQTNLAGITSVTAIVPTNTITALTGGATGASKVTVNYVGGAADSGLTYAQTTGSGIADSLTVNVGTASADGIDRGDITASTIETLTVNSVSKTSTAANTVGLSAAAATKVVLSGAALTIDSTNFAGESTIDASAMTGILTLGSEVSTDQTIIGGSANDAITFASADLNTNDSVDGGAGNDTVTIATNGTSTVTYGRVALTNVENLVATFNIDDGGDGADAHSIDLRNSALTTVKAQLTGATVGNTYSDTVAINNIQSSTTKMTVHVIDDDYAGTVTLDSDRNTSGNLVMTATAGENFASGTVATTGDWTSFAITQTGSSSTSAHTLAFTAESPLTSLSVAATEQAVTFSSITASKLASLTITGDNAVTVTSLSQSTAALAAVDASASSGAITLTATTRTAAASVTTGVGDDSIELTLTTEGGNTIDAGSNTTVADASTGDTLNFNGSATGSTVVDLSVTTDQITTINGVANSATQIGFEHVSASGTTVVGGTFSITGSSGINYLTGANGNDTIDGGSGNDVIDGGKGTDTILLGSGSSEKDTVYLDSPLVAGYGNDVISGFAAGTVSSSTGGDVLRLKSLDGVATVAEADVRCLTGSGIGATKSSTDWIMILNGTSYATSALAEAASNTLGATATAATGNSDVYIIWSDGTNAYISYDSDYDSDGTALITVATLVGVTETTLSSLVVENLIAVA